MDLQGLGGLTSGVPGAHHLQGLLPGLAKATSELGVIPGYRG